MATAKYDYRKESLVPSADGMTGTRGWAVDACDSIIEALTAPPAAGDPPIAQINESFPGYGAVRCRSTPCNRVAPKSYEIIANYGIPPTGEGWQGGADNVDPLERKPSVTWRTGRIAVPTEIDTYGYPLVNSAGDSRDPAETRYLKVKYLTIIRWEKGYDYERYGKYEDAVNEKDIVIRGSPGDGKVVFRAGEVHCDTIEPAEVYSPDQIILPIAFNFEIIQEWRVNPQSGELTRMRNPWRVLSAFKDKGLTGWASVSGTLKKGDLYYADDSEKVSTEIALDGTGRPIDPNIRVSLDGLTFYTPQSHALYWPDHYITDYSTADLKIIEPRMLIERDFNELDIYKGG